MDHLENFDDLEGLTDLEGLADLRLDDLISDEFSFDDLEGFGDPEEPEKWETPETEDTSEEEEPPETEDTSEEEEPLETEDTPEEEETPEVPEARGKRGRPKVEKQDRAIITMLSVVLALLVALIVVVAVLKFYVLVNWRLYPKNALELDLREKTLSVTEYDAIQEKLPNCRILWNVPFQDGTVSSDVTELTVTALSDEDLAALAYLPELTTLHAEACTDYPQLSAFRESRPDCRVLCRVQIGGKTYDQDTQLVTVSTLTAQEGELLDFLPKLKTVDAENCGEYALLATLQAAHPDWDVRYTVKMGDSALSKAARTATVTGADSAQLIAGMAGLPELEALELKDPKADGATLFALRAQYPEVKLSWYFDMKGTLADETATEVDASGRDFSSLEEAENMASCFPKLEKFIMSNCTVNGQKIDNETMADFRERMRSEYKVVWTVECGKLKVRTDDTTFMPTREREYYFKDDMGYNLRYCEDMICIDIGHHPVKDISFVRYMPHLKYLILTDTAVQDISPLENAKELIYLEFTFGIIRDYTPLLGCTALEDLNMDNLWYFADPAPLYQMTWLKTLFWEGCSGSVILKLQEALTETRLDFTGSTSNSVGTGWRNLQNYYDMRDILGMPYMR